MKNILTKIVIGFLCVLTLFSVTACKKDPPIENGEGNQIFDDVVYEDTDVVMAESGTTDYVIVTSDSPTAYAGVGVGELSNFFYEATGARLATFTESQVDWSLNSKFFVIGVTDFCKEAGVDTDVEALGVSGYKIVKRGNSVFMFGGNYGDLYAVYDYMHIQLGYECYAQDEIALTKTDKLYLKEFDDIAVKPNIQLQIASNDYLARDTSFMRRRRCLTNTNVMGSLGGSNVHNFELLIPRDKYPEFYTNGYLCMTSDPEKLARIVADEIIVLLKNDKAVLSCGFSQIDNASAWCSCSDCSSEKMKYGTDSGAYIKLMNRVCEMVDDEYLSIYEPEREFIIWVLAYNKSLVPPVKYNDVSCEYEPIDEEVKGHRLLGVVFAPYYTTNFLEKLTSPSNEATYETLKQWGSCVDNLFVWWYQSYFVSYGDYTPFDNFEAIADTYKTMGENGVYMIFNQQRSFTADWVQLKMYLEDKAAINPNVDMNKLIDDFMVNYYKEAAKPMQELFNDYRLHMKTIRTIYSNEIKGFPEGNIKKEKFFPHGTLQRFLNKIEEAYKAIEKYKGIDDEYYQKLYDRICFESMSYRLLNILLYESLYSIDDIARMKEEFNADANRLNLSIDFEQTI